jgi:hypothetical protein
MLSRLALRRRVPPPAVAPLLVEEIKQEAARRGDSPKGICGDEEDPDDGDPHYREACRKLEACL